MRLQAGDEVHVVLGEHLQQRVVRLTQLGIVLQWTTQGPKSIPLHHFRTQTDRSLCTGVCVCGAYQQITMWDGEEKLDEGLQGVVQGVVAVETEDAEVDVVAAEHGLEHGEADGDALELERVHLVLWHLAQSQDAVP